MNQRMELPVNLPDTTEIRGVADPFPENSGQNASESGGKWKTGLRVLVCGGRDFDDAELVERTLCALRPAPSVIIHGGARGADHLGALWGEHFASAETYLPDWQRHGRAAGPLRNQRMIDEGKPDLVVAFPGGRGTADMVRRAKVAGIEVREVP